MKKSVEFGTSRPDPECSSEHKRLAFPVAYAAFFLVGLASFFGLNNLWLQLPAFLDRPVPEGKGIGNVMSLAAQVCFFRFTREAMIQDVDASTLIESLFLLERKYIRSLLHFCSGSISSCP
jgi:hypothetical protein